MMFTAVFRVFAHHLLLVKNEVIFITEENDMLHDRLEVHGCGLFTHSMRSNPQAVAAIGERDLLVYKTIQVYTDLLKEAVSDTARTIIHRSLQHCLTMIPRENRVLIFHRNLLHLDARSTSLLFDVYPTRLRCLTLSGVTIGGSHLVVMRNLPYTLARLELDSMAIDMAGCDHLVMLRYLALHNLQALEYVWFLGTKICIDVSKLPPKIDTLSLINVDIENPPDTQRVRSLYIENVDCMVSARPYFAELVALRMRIPPETTRMTGILHWGNSWIIALSHTLEVLEIHSHLAEHPLSITESCSFPRLSRIILNGVRMPLNRCYLPVLRYLTLENLIVDDSMRVDVDHLFTKNCK